MYHLTEAYLLASFISLLAAGWGAIAVGASAVPRLLSATVEPDTRAFTMQSYWRGFLKWAMCLGLAATLIIACGTPFSAIPTIYALLLTAIAGLMTICYYLAWATTPRMNQLLIGLGLLSGLILIAALIYVLPGQFTFWPTAG